MATDPSKKSQCDLVLLHLRTQGEITPLEALRLYGCFRLGARIWDLRHGTFGVEVAIDRRFVTDPHSGKRYAAYSLSRSAALQAA